MVPAEFAGAVVADGVKEISTSHELSHQHCVALVKAGPHELHYVGILQILQNERLPAQAHVMF